MMNSQGSARDSAGTEPTDSGGSLSDGSENELDRDDEVLSDDELDRLSAPSKSGEPNTAGGARSERLHRSWIVKNAEQEIQDSDGA